MGGDLGPLVPSHPTTPAQAHAARLTLAELALRRHGRPGPLTPAYALALADLATALAVLGLDGDDD